MMVGRVRSGLTDDQGGNTQRYRLHELQGIEAVVVAEGEKDVDALRTIGIPATCNHGGASKNKWRDDHAQNLLTAGVRRVVVIPDRDEPGYAHADVVAQSCRRAGLTVTFVILPDVSEKGDVSDYLARHTTAELLPC